jgi:hypothetical protein
MSKTVLTCARVFDGLTETLAGPTDILAENNVIVDVGKRSVVQPRRLSSIWVIGR